MPEQKDNPFREPTKEEREQLEKQKKEREKVFKEAGELAKKCLNDPKFVKYKNKYELLLEKVINSLIEYDDPDHMRYAFNVRIAFAKLHQLKLLLHDVEVDNRPRKK